MKTEGQSPKFAILTPTGRGAIATIGVCGAGAVELVGRRFRPASGKALSELPMGRAVFGRFEASSAAAEELVVGLLAADEVEIHCHGGQAAAAAICSALAAEGANPITTEAWARRQEKDAIAAAALLALAEARTERVAAILLDQYRGALRAAVNAMITAVVRYDFADAYAGLEELVARIELGRHLTDPWKIVLAGATNAGKSSLMNAILGYQRSIVWHQPGTTRDVLSATTALEGWPVELFDTAGIYREDEAPAEPIEAEGVERARGQIANADLRVFVADLTAPWNEGLYELVRSQCRQAPLVVHSKCDLARPDAAPRPGGIAVSAVRGEGIRELCTAMAGRLVPAPPPPGAAVPFTAGQIAELKVVRRKMQGGKMGALVQRLDSLLVQ